MVKPNTYPSPKRTAIDILTEQYRQVLATHKPSIHTSHKLWVIKSMLELVSTSNRTPLDVMEAFKNKMEEYETVDDIWEYCADYADDVIGLFV